MSNNWSQQAVSTLLLYSLRGDVMKKVVVCIMVILSIALTGCSSVEDRVKMAIMDKAGITVDSDYVEYRTLDEDGRLNENGEIADADFFDEGNVADIKAGTIHVTFAENRYLLIKYYLDAALTKRIDTADCYLNPGDSIYADVLSINRISNMFGISYFTLIEYGDNAQVKSQSKHFLNENLVCTIPEDYKGTELSLMPIGEYFKRKLTLQAYYVDDNGEQVTLGNAGKWFINEELCSRNTAIISPIVSYALKYDYDEKNYFYVCSAPKCFTEDPDSAGFVEFWSADPTVELSNYSVELHPYLSISLVNDEKATLKLNDNEEESLKKGKSWSNNKLKYGDIIVIETSSNCTITNGDYHHIHVDKDPIIGGYRYTLTVTPEINSDTQEKLKVNEYITITLPAVAAHGTCTYKLEKSGVAGIAEAQTNQTLTITYTITDSSYRFGDGNFFSSTWNWGQDLVGDMSKSVTIQLSPEMNNTTINPDEWFEIIKKGA